MKKGPDHRQTSSEGRVMIIQCPHCGTRDSSEFTFRGEASRNRPAYEDGTSAFCDYVYHRDNVAGVGEEHWYHSAGCQSWLIVERDTRTHAIHSVILARASLP